jgi:hypothetical protein
VDYQSVGRSLQKRVQERHQELQHELIAAVKGALVQHPEHDFVRALCQHARGNSEFLVQYLRSGRPISADQREQFAQVLEGVLDDKRKRGRPSHSNERSAAMQAGVLYKMWRDENKKAGVKDHGYGDAMKREAVRFVINDLEPRSQPLNAEAVRQLMDRPRSRRERKPQIVAL